MSPDFRNVFQPFLPLSQIHRQETPLLTRAAALALLSVFTLSTSSAWGHSQKLPVRLQPKPPGASDPLNGMLLPHQRNWRSLNQIYEFDRFPLGKRIPVILVPGRAEEFQHNSWWKDFNRIAHRNEVFRNHFKLYVFLYNSKEELDVQAHGLAMELKKRFGRLTKKQPLMLVTYSLGGVIARETLKEADALERVDTLVGIAVPFHGSPMFDPEWFSEYLDPPNRSPIRRYWDRVIYRSYMFSKSNLTRGLRWDNFDRSKPQFHPQHVKISGDQALPTVADFQEYPLADEIRAKTVIYASYLENGYTNSNQAFNPMRLPLYVLDRSVNFPRNMLGSILPVYGGSVHSVFTYMNVQLANLPTFTPEDPQGKNTHLYRYNDGAIPLSSMLFLKGRETSYEEDIQELVKAATVRKVRIFVNLDHTHIGEYALFKRKLVTEDFLHPEDGKHSPTRWIIRDLLERRESAEFISKLGPQPSRPIE